MKPLQLVRCAIYSSVAILLAACSDNGSDNDDPGDGVPDVPSSPVPLSSKADIQREVGNFIDVYSIFFGEELDAAAAGTAALKSARVNMDQVVPKVASTSDCELKGTVTEDSGTKARTFAYFEVSPSVEFSSSLYKECQSDDGDGDGTYTEANGFQESGGGAGVSTFYSYNVLGQDGKAYTELERSPTAGDEFDFESIRGLFETATTASSVETRHVYTLRFEEEDEDEDDGNTSGQVTQGKQGDPFVTIVTSSGVSVEGPYEYATTECKGGRARIETDTPVVFDEEGLPIGGAVTVTSGTASATVTFVGDGSATYQFGSGATGTLTRAELEAAVDGC